MIKPSSETALIASIPQSISCDQKVYYLLISWIFWNSFDYPRCGMIQTWWLAKQMIWMNESKNAKQRFTVYCFVCSHNLCHLRMECNNRVRFQLIQDVIWTSIQCYLNFLDIRWTSKQRCLLAGIDLVLLFEKKCYCQNKISTKLKRKSTTQRLFIQIDSIWIIDLSYSI